MAGRLRRLRPLVPPAALFAGLFLFGVSLLMLGTEATEEGTRELDPSRLVAENGTALLVYRTHYLGERTERIDVAYRYPQAAGDAFFVGCDDLTRLRSGNEPADPLLAFANLREGSFVVSRQTVPDPLAAYVKVPVTRNTAEGSEQPTQTVTRYCPPAVAFRWSATEGDPSLNRPNVTVSYHSAQLDGDAFAFLAILMGGSALLALLGGLAWARARAGEPRPPPADDSTVETLRASLDRMGEQLERTRKHLLMGGVLGVFLWYPFLVPWAWQQAARSTDDPVIPWAVAALTLAFLLALTVLWAREFLRLDHELDEWRARMGELRDREEYLMTVLEQGG